MIRTATPDDIPAIAELIRALADYERLSHEVLLDDDALRTHLFGARPYAEVLIAEAETIDGARAPSPAPPEPDPSPAPAIRPAPDAPTSRASDAEASRALIVGFALFFHTFSTFLAKPGIWLEDLFVKPDHRGRGYGRALLAELARIAVERGCGRLEWSVLDWNEPSIAFYRSLGARPMDDWTTYRLTGDALRQLADGRTNDD